MDKESFHQEQMKLDEALITSEIQKAVTELSKSFAQDPFCYSTARSANHISFAVSGLFDKPSDEFMQETVTRFERLYPDINLNYEHIVNGRRKLWFTLRLKSHIPDSSSESD